MRRAFGGAIAVAVSVGLLWPGLALAQQTGTRSSSFAYDATSGLLTQEVIEPNTSALRLQTDYTYDAYGNKTAATVSGVDITTRGASTTYDAQGRFAVSATNALGQSESWAHDARFGLPTSHTGPNGLTTTWSYDGFGRKVSEVRPDGTSSQFTYAFCSGFNGGTATCPSGAVRLAQAVSYAPGGTTQNAPLSLIYFDSLEREIARDTQGFDGSVVRAARQYDALGRVWKVSRPYFVSGGTPQWTVYTYDALGRPTQIQHPDGGVTQNAYHGLSTTETNAVNQTRITVKNSMGDVVSVTDATSQTMSYSYDPFGKLKSTTDAAGNVVAASYDTRGRKITSSDPNMGFWTYSYNVLGELKSQTDAKSQTVTQSYDLLGRLTQRVEPDMTASWSYDTAAYGIGKLASTSITAGPSAGYARAFAYDSLGRPAQVNTTIDGTTYTFTAGYDASSRLTQVAYPSGFVAQYSYNSLGYANQMKNGTTAQVHWTANAIDAEQRITQSTLGNGVVTANSFSNTNGRLLMTLAGPGNAVQNASYGYDLVGNLTSRADNTSNLSESFTYDPLNRLLTATTNVNLQKSFTYDVVGNLLTKSDVGTYAYPAPGSARPHAVMSISGSILSTTYTYDQNGNQTAGLGRSVTWTSYNKPDTITQGVRSAAFLHDMDHQRFKQVSTEGTTLYLNAFGVMAELIAPGTSGAHWNDYLSVGNVKVGLRVTEVVAQTVTTRYFHTDHLGSIAAITNEAGTVVERLSYDAWGKRRFPNGTDDTAGSIESLTTRGFTNHEQLDVVGLVHMNGRVYDPMIGRMISADPIVPDAFNSQAWNRYAYVGNNPLTFTDPSGHSWFSDFFGRVFHGIKTFLQRNPIVAAIIQIAVAAILSPFVASIVIAAAASAAIVTGLSGGNLGQMLRAGAIAGATAFAFNVVGNITGHAPGFGTPAHAANIAGHAGVGCLSSVASGGSCESGALSGAVGSAAGPLAAQIDGGNLFAGAALRGAIGGLASVAGGGKFENGAVTAAFGYLFNEVAGSFDRKTGVLNLRDLDTGAEVSKNFFSGSGFGDEVPAGNYAILQRGQKDGFRLEPIDGNFGDDVHSISGRSLLRLHGPGRSIGCVTACTPSDWDGVRSTILNTNTGTAVVNTYKSLTVGGREFWRFQTGVELIKKYGTLEVK